MYNHTLRIPRLTPAKMALLNDLFPGLNRLVTIPQLVTEADVRTYVADYSATLPRYEYVREITALHLDEATQQWCVNLIISGD